MDKFILVRNILFLLLSALDLYFEQTSYTVEEGTNLTICLVSFGSELDGVEISYNVFTEDGTATVHGMGRLIDIILYLDPIHLSVRPSACYPSICLSVCLSVCLFVRMSVCYLEIYLINCTYTLFLDYDPLDTQYTLSSVSDVNCLGSINVMINDDTTVENQQSFYIHGNSSDDLVTSGQGFIIIYIEDNDSQ